MVKSIEKRGTAYKQKKRATRGTSPAKLTATTPAATAPVTSLKEEILDLKERALIELEIGLKSHEEALSEQRLTLKERMELTDRERKISERGRVSERRREVITGIIVSQETGGYYQVQIGQRQVRVKSAISETLTPNIGVVIGETSEGFFIVGTEKYKDRTRRTITITG